MNAWLLASAGVLLVTIYVAAVQRALGIFSRSALERRLEDRPRSNAASWLFPNTEAALLAVSLLHTVLRFGFFLLVLVGVGLVPFSRAAWWQWIVALAGATVALWLAGNVFAWAVARYAPEGVMMSALGFLRVLTVLCLPFTRSVSFVDEAVRRLTGANVRDLERGDTELIRTIVDTHRDSGLDEGAAVLLRNIVEFRTTDVGEVMTPRTDIDGLAYTDDLAEIRRFVLEVGHSRVPIYRENLDNIAGILYVKDLLPYLGEDAGDFKLEPILRRPIIIPETKSVSDLLKEFQRGEVHMAIVVDEYGGTSGLVTIEDVLEEIVGEIHDELDTDDAEEPTLEVIDETHAEVDARYHIDDLNERLALDLPEEDEYDTVGGYMMAKLGHVPRAGEAFEAHSARFTALEATPTHVRRIAVEIVREGEGAAEG